MKTNPHTFEAIVCSRCGGSGHYSYNPMSGSTCFKCHGVGHVLTKRGVAAKAWLNDLCSVPATSVKVGDRVRASYGMDGSVVVWATVVETGVSRSGYYVGETLVPFFDLVCEHPRYGKVNMGFMEGGKVRLPASKDQIAAALEYQASLTKAGAPRRATVGGVL